jgi:phosphoribosyl 1,2-cyclic phosphodiesterase
LDVKVKFYGTRGSISVSEKDCVEFGGNTSCVLVKFPNERILIFDAGTGIRRLGNDLMANGHEQHDNIFIALSHTHWDHIQGFPFFSLAYDPRRNLTLGIPGGITKANNLHDIFTTQMQEEFFPVSLENMGANISCWEPNIDKYTSPFGVHVTTIRHQHPGGANSYRVEDDGKVLVYCTDIEHGESIDPKIVDFSRDADLLIHDAQYTSEELPQRKGWGHSTWEQAVEVAEQAGAKRLALFHHDPMHTDSFLLHVEKQCQVRFRGSVMAREGMEIEL